MQFVLIVIHDHLNIKLYNQIRHHVLMQGQSYESYEDYAELWKDHYELLQVIKTGEIDKMLRN